MKDVKRYKVSALSDPSGTLIMHEPEVTVVYAFAYDAALSKLAAETLRADTAEAELKNVRKSRDEELENYNALIYDYAAAEQRVSELEKVLDRIARPHDCGCWPCMGSCVSQEALQITVDEMRERAGAALNPTPKEESHE